MKANAIRQAFLKYFGSNGHQIVHSGSLIPHNDPSLLFTNAGMVQFKSYFTGEKKPEFTRAATSQKCLRAGGKHNDLENVGYTARHHTFFEMLGSFSFGDYFKAEAIEYSWKFLTDELQISPEKLYITVYKDDDEAFSLWKKITNFSDSKIIKIAGSDNFWSMGDTGPCGPCSEIFYDHGTGISGGLPGSTNSEGDRYVEIWNLVFMQYEQMADGSRKNLPKTSIDTGMGLERIAAVMQGVHSNYDIDLFRNLIKAIVKITDSTDINASHKVIADHLRSVCFLIADGVLPSNEGRGYVLRRIMRRAMRHLNKLGYKESGMYQLVPKLIEEMGDAYPELARAQSIAESYLKLEEDRFRETLGRGLKLLNTEIKGLATGSVLSGNTAFKLYDTYGFPLDLTMDILRSYDISVNLQEFDAAMKQQKARAKAAWKGSEKQRVNHLWHRLHHEYGATKFIGYTDTVTKTKVLAIVDTAGDLQKYAVAGQEVWMVLEHTPFYAESGGQIGDTGTIGANEVHDVQKFSDIYAHKVQIKEKTAVGNIINAAINVERRNKIKANHSATHLLHFVLRESLGNHVTQKGSIVTDKKLRFDFTHVHPLTAKETTHIEDRVNSLILANLQAGYETLSYDDAIDKGVIALFGEKYSHDVRVVSMGESIELCGGTHVNRTGDIGLCKIISEESIASGVRRIEAITGPEVINYLRAKDAIISNATATLKCAETEINPKLSNLLADYKSLEKQLTKTKLEKAISQDTIIHDMNDFKIASSIFENLDAKQLKQVADHLLKRHSSIIIVLATAYMGKSSFLITISDNLKEKFNSAELIETAFPYIGGKGGGKAVFAQAGGSDTTKLNRAVKAVVHNITGSK